ncbi:hypothetical protein GN958_ATG03081 [Phytophthora infestans]|uniref:Uncharacterized protein n=1 Tax=Phytophthora infestans TaxID=4787 RepID=A0A8S9V2N0_PHYIN|nr:hypothetical protein GN958_ATG03081 [Phytophthora infestans]
MNPARALGPQPPPRQRFMEFMQTVSTCDALCERENAALRAQVHDLIELLAAFDLCEIVDAHLSAVRERAFSRDIAPDAALLQVYRMERQLQQTAILNRLDGEFNERELVSGLSEQVESSLSFESSLSSGKRDGGSLQLRVGILEREVANLHLRQDLLLKTNPRLKTPAAVDGHGDDKMKILTQQQQRITELEKALATMSAKNAELKQQDCRYHEVEEILTEFSERQ